MSNHLFKNKAFFKEISTMIDAGQVVSFPVKGTSMRPFLKEGNTEVFVQKGTEYNKNDICLFQYQGKTILHRLIKIKDNQYYFRGDHLLQYEIVDESDILAKVIYFITDHKQISSTDRWLRFRVTVCLLLKQVKASLRMILKRKK